MIHSQFIEHALIDSSKIASKNFNDVSSVVIKLGDNNQVLTETDIAVGKYIVSEVQKIYPTHNIIDEETGIIDKKSDYTWVIDPIDGTSNFVVSSPQYGIMIGLLYQNKPIAGGMALPYYSEIITAEKNCGAFYNDNKLEVTKEPDLLSSLVAYGMDGHQEKPTLTYDELNILARIVLNVRNIRAAGSLFDSAMVAKGKYGAYLNRTSKIWDVVGLHIIIEEAGGVVTDFFGKPMDYSYPLTKIDTNYTFCIGAPLLHKQLQEIIHSTQ
ncbi:inositol monophosphatase [Candidatus Roizmanbacteria bacterium CG10_big_fil_rev_8_21_14_0_10_39_6]|uniref:Inositol monophosphatase n=1 Tax=Candidatus Roizmanbacteria bacterium CG10_big_fil_rev_8_21_14_0_10_39_6 TaxID=1974853 RepID=A0A2M8KT79_9BACT|nr:MAG: inositol monophosphatase [Candidatus Roizmanbacteria bacterium CG10_big_fil_rev_8_21_14_0_10_39_6]